MITGDHHSTAIAVAKDVGMIKPDAEILLIDVAPQTKAHPPQLSTADQTVEGLPRVSTSSPSTGVRFEFDEEQLPADQGSAPPEERQAPAASIDNGLVPAALPDEGHQPAALANEEQQPTAIVDEGQTPADLVGQCQGQLPTGLIHDRQQPEACISQRHLPTGLIHEGQAPTAPDAVSTAPAVAAPEMLSKLAAH